MKAVIVYGDPFQGQNIFLLKSVYTNLIMNWTMNVAITSLTVCSSLPDF